MTEEDTTTKPLPPADTREEFRRLLHCIYSVRETLGHIGEQAETLLPGESIGEYKKSLIQTEDALLHLENQYIQIIEYFDLNGGVNPPIPLTKVDIDNIHAELTHNHMTGAMGEAKLSTFSRIKDKFYQFLFEKPFNETTQEKTIETAIQYAEYAGTFMSSIPGAHMISEAVGYTKQLLSTRLRRLIDKE